MRPVLDTATDLLFFFPFFVRLEHRCRKALFWKPVKQYLPEKYFTLAEFYLR